MYSSISNLANWGIHLFLIFLIFYTIFTDTFFSFRQLKSLRSDLTQLVRITVKMCLKLPPQYCPIFKVLHDFCRYWTLKKFDSETDQNVDWRCTALQTTARRDISRTRMVCHSSKTGQKWGDSRVMPRQNFWRKNVKMYIKTSFFKSDQEFKKIWKTVLQE